MAEHSTSSSWKTNSTHHITSIEDQRTPKTHIKSRRHTRNHSSLASTTSPTSEASLLSNESDVIDISHVLLSAHNLTSLSPMDASTKYNRTSSFLPETSQTRPASPTRKSFKLFSKHPSSYNPAITKSNVNSSKDTTKSDITAKRFSQRKSLLKKSQDVSIPEEEFDLNLLSAAIPMAYQKKFYDKTASEETENEDAPMVSPMAIPFDLSLFHEPMNNSTLTPAMREQINRQEAAGILTGGLGAGFTPDTTITSTDLMAESSQSSTTASRLSRRLTLRNAGLSRASALKDLAQNEANRRGEVIEVIVQGPVSAPMDISSFAGHTIGTPHPNFDFKSMDSLPLSINKKGTFKSSNIEVFYPQANWKPFSMRAPYLTALIIISIILGAAEEYLYQKSLKKPLYSFTSPSLMKTWDYFCFKYLPTLVAVTFGVLWQITDFEVKRLEAYYQLSKEGGALAAESINVDYITFFNVLRPFRALLFKHYAVAVSSIATLMAVSLVPTLQSASVVLIPSRAERKADPGVMKGIVISGPWSRLLSLTLWLCAIFGCILLWQLERRPSGLVADVKGVAGIAAMANRSHILMDFKDMDTATPDMIHQKLKAHRYTLRNSSLAPEDSIILTQADKDKYDSHQHHDENPHPLFLRLIAGIPFVIGMFLFTILIPIILFTPANIITDKAPWLLTLGAVSIKLCWGSLETAIRMIEPFYILSLRHASPTALTLDYTAMAFGWLPIRAFFNGHYLVATVGLGSVLAEILTVCITSFSTVTGTDFTSALSRTGTSKPHHSNSTLTSGEETYVSFWASFFLALFILLSLILISIISYTRRRHAFLPRQPSSIASILAFIYQSKMLYDFVGTEKLNNREMEERLVGIGKSYGLGWFKGRDGEMHCGVDEEELSGGYLHGRDKKAEGLPWSSNWQDY
ncbi:ebe364ee-83dc-4e6b-86d9-11974cea1879-CDS [Sclerotinia trifoliorum]|uniref:Ebe364ee-83dc-4e6b-86d9-11974cea1879-CDS n=1 Tax=Sclerotinia trifoliorum TaxID=28548 RepID=A0A8H2W0K0_9HELO|nr:ebe364ee-83dc-4e6b-86d9-11974cea1879-CDS [Sclerotinia trifoliorum]